MRRTSSMVNLSPQSAANDKWNIETRWLDIAGLGKEAKMLLDVIQDRAPKGDDSFPSSEPPRWSTSQLYNFVRARMSQLGLNRAIKELHEKNILHMALAYHGTFGSQRKRRTGLYKDPSAFHEALQRAGITYNHKLDSSGIEIYLVLPEDVAINYAANKVPNVDASLE